MINGLKSRRRSSGGAFRHRENVFNAGGVMFAGGSSSSTKGQSGASCGLSSYSREVILKEQFLSSVSPSSELLVAHILSARLTSARTSWYSPRKSRVTPCQTPGPPSPPSPDSVLYCLPVDLKQLSGGGAVPGQHPPPAGHWPPAGAREALKC